jgi:hypothetical protein
VGEGLAVEMGVQETHAAKAGLADPKAGELGDHDALGVADVDFQHVPPAVYQDPDLPTGLSGNLGQGSGQFGRQDTVRGDPFLKESLEILLLAGLQSQDVALQVADGWAPPLAGILFGMSNGGAPERLPS